MSPEYICKHINIMVNSFKKPLHSTMKGNKFTFYSDETQGITSVEQLASYATFILNKYESISKVVETH